MNTIRIQHLIPGTAILGLALVVTWLSFTREPADAFLFPQLISVAMLVLAVWNFIRAAFGFARVGTGLALDTLKTITPGIVIMLIYMFFLAKILGFYVASFTTFITIYSLYDPASHIELKSWIKRVAVAFGFMCIVYLLFTVLLKVQTPRGLFF